MPQHTNAVRKNSTIISDDEGVSIGTASGYVSRFKKIDAGEEVRNVPEFTSAKEKIKSLPSVWEGNDKEILTHYYRRFGDHTCTDFDDISGKIASNINRLFKKTFTPEDVLKMLAEKVTI